MLGALASEGDFHAPSPKIDRIVNQMETYIRENPGSELMSFIGEKAETTNKKYLMYGVIYYGGKMASQR